MYDGTAHHALVTHKFTGKERDSESNLDNFGARYNSSGLGRFLSPDYQDDDDAPIALASGLPSDPQSLNLYIYAKNNPLNRVDIDGHASWKPCVSSGTSGQCFTGDYQGERYCGFSSGCLFWNSATGQWETKDPTAPSPSDLAGWWFQGFVRLSLGDSFGFKQMGYAYGKLALVSFGGWNLLKPPGSGGNQAGVRPSIVPDHWLEKPARNGKGTIYYDPGNTYNDIRVGDDGFMRIKVDGHYIDVNGNQVLKNDPAAHIPVDTPMKSPFLDAPGIDVPLVE